MSSDAAFTCWGYMNLSALAIFRKHILPAVKYKIHGAVYACRPYIVSDSALVNFDV